MSLRLPGQRPIHMTSESPARRKTILSTLATTGAGVLIYNASGYSNQVKAREAVMAALTDEAAKLGASMLIIEADDAVVDADVAVIRARIEHAGCQDTLRYEHKRPHEEILLGIPDAVAWAWSRGAPWRERARGLVSQVTEV